MEIAVFGGTFDPPTLAHEAIMTALLDEADLDQVWVMPSGERVDKAPQGSCGARLAMLGIVQTERFADNPRLVISDFEMQLPQPTQTHRTVAALAHAYPDDAFHYVFGADSYRSMRYWERGKELSRNLSMFVVSRMFLDIDYSDRVRPLRIPDGNDTVSSTSVRLAVANDWPFARYLSPPVERYIRDQGLYVPPEIMP